MNWRKGCDATVLNRTASFWAYLEEEWWWARFSSPANPTGNSRFLFWEVPVGNSFALRAGFYPGDNFEHEFAYPKGLSRRIASASHQPVLTTEATTSAEMKEAPVVAEAPAEPAPVAEVTPAPPVAERVI